MRKFICFLFLITLTLGNINAQKGYEKSIEVGTTIGAGKYSNTTFGASMINGYRFNEYFFIGAGVGIGYANALTGIDIDKQGITTEYRMDAYLIPIYANFKANFSKNNLSPFFRLNIGYTFDVNQYMKDAPGVTIEPAVGLDIKLSKKNTIYAAFGFNLQHSEYTYTRNVGATDSNWDITTKSEMLKSISIKLGIKF